MSVELLDTLNNRSYVSRTPSVNKVVNTVRVRPNLFYTTVDKDRADELIETVKEVATKEGRKGLERLGLKATHNQGNPQQWYQLIYWFYANWGAQYPSGSQNDSLILYNNGTPVQSLGLTLGAYYTDPNGQYADVIFIFIDNSSSTYTADSANLYANVGLYVGNYSSGNAVWSPQYNLATASNLSISKTSTQVLLFVWVLTFQLASGIACNNPQAFLMIFPALFGFSNIRLENSYTGSGLCMSYNGGNCFGTWTWAPVLYNNYPAFMFSGVLSNIPVLSSICVYFDPAGFYNDGSYDVYACVPSPVSSVSTIQAIVLLWVLEVS